MTDLHPPRFNASVAEDIDGGRVVGLGVLDNGNHALLWSGTAESAIDLHPAGMQFSEARGIRGTQVVGRGGNLAGHHALMWPDGTPGSVVDLHPPGYVVSGAMATTGTLQGGYGGLAGTGFSRPLIWSGTSHDAIDLTPPDVMGGLVLGMSGDQQTGHVILAERTTHAMLWRGTAESAVNLHPLSGFFSSTAEDTNGRHQVGYGLGPATGGENHALLWSGTNVPLDLHGFLPAGATSSVARGIDEQGNVVGQATFGQSARAVIWVYVPDPTGSVAFLLIPTALLSRSGPRACRRE